MKKSTKSAVLASSKLAEITGLETKLHEMREAYAAERLATLRGLPAANGFSDVETFIKAVRNAHKGGKTRKAKAGAERKARVSITPEKREAIIADLKANMAGLEVANKHDISLATVQNIKKAAGLVAARTA